MNEAAELFIKVTGDVSEAQAALGSVEKQVQSTATTVEQKGGGAFSKFGSVAQGAIQGVGLAIGSMGIGVAVGAITAGFENVGHAIDLASDKAEAASKDQVLFGDSYDIVAKASENAATSVGLSSGAYLDAAGNVGNLVTNFGLAGDAGAKMSTDIVQLSADMGSFNNMSTDQAVEAIGSAFRGESEPIRAFGVMLDEATIKSKALEMGLIHQGDALDKTSRMQATYKLILEQTTNAQGDFARTSDGYANSQRIAAAKQEEAWTKLGEVIKPIAGFLQTTLSNVMAGIVEGIANVAGAVTGWVDANQPLIHSIGDVIATVADLYHGYLEKVFGLLQDLWSFIQGPLHLALDALGTVFRVVADAVGIFVNAIGTGVDALHNIHRAIDPNMAAMEDLQTQFYESGKAAGLSADQIDDAWSKALEAAKSGSAGTVTSVDEYIQSYKDAAADDSRESIALSNAQAWTSISDSTAAGVADVSDALSGMNKAADDAWTAFGQAPIASMDETNARLDELHQRLDKLNSTDLATLGPAAYDGWQAAKVATQKQIDDITAYITAAGPKMAQAAGDSMDGIAQQWIAKGEAAVGQFKALGEAVPENIATGMVDNGHALIDAADRLIELLKNGLDPAEQAAKLEGAKYTKAVADGVVSGIPGAKEAAQQVAVQAIATIEKAANGSPDTKGLKAIGSYYDSLLASGLNASSIKVALEAAGVSDDVIDKLAAQKGDYVDTGETWDTNIAGGIKNKDGTIETAVNSAVDPMQNQPTGSWGADLAQAWREDITSVLRKSKTTINAAVRWATSGLGPTGSPPHAPDSPLHDADKWAEDTGDAYMGGLQRSIKRGKGPLSGVIDDAVGNALKSWQGKAAANLGPDVSRIFDATARHNNGNSVGPNRPGRGDGNDNKGDGKGNNPGSNPGVGSGNMTVTVKHDITPAFAKALKEANIDAKQLASLIAEADKELAFNLKQQRAKGK